MSFESEQLSIVAAAQDGFDAAYETPRLNFEVQHGLVAKEALIGCFAAMSFSGSVI